MAPIMNSMLISILFGLIGVFNAFATGKPLNSKDFPNLGPLCISSKYLECHKLAQDNYSKCSESDTSCQCYYINVVYEECIKLCPTYHHETLFLLNKLCADDVSTLQSYFESLPLEDVVNEDQEKTKSKMDSGEGMDTILLEDEISSRTGSSAKYSNKNRQSINNNQNDYNSTIKHISIDLENHSTSITIIHSYYLLLFGSLLASLLILYSNH